MPLVQLPYVQHVFLKVIHFKSFITSHHKSFDPYGLYQMFKVVGGNCCASVSVVPDFLICSPVLTEAVITYHNRVNDLTVWDALAHTLNSRLSGIMVGMEITVNRKPG
jgi:hypothetical protein